MAKTIGSYKGLWKQESGGRHETAVQMPPPPASVHKTAIPATAQMPSPASVQKTVIPATAQMPSPPATMQKTISPAIEHAPQKSAIPAADLTPLQSESPEQLAHQYRMLVLREHRFKLGRDLLESGSQDPWFLAWMSVTSFGRSFRPWAHERIFALGCYLGVEMSPEILKQLRHPLFMSRYRRSMFGLWRLLEILAQKTGQKTGSRVFFRLFYLCPPLGVLIYEKKLQSLLRKARTSPVAVAPVMAGAGQGQ